MTMLDRPEARSSRVLGGQVGSWTCRDRLRQVLEVLDERRTVSYTELLDIVGRTGCSVGHDLHYARLKDFIDTDEDGQCATSRQGADWLLEHGRPSPDWQKSIAPGTAPLRQWQAEALEAWAAHGRQGVVEAVTGTGKSRVGIEAAREACADDYSVIIAVPSKELVMQWVKALRENGVPRVGTLAEGQRATLQTHDVIVGTIQSLYLAPPTREDGKVLLIADECHRYGAGQWKRALHPSYRRRLGLTATFERNDDGINDLLAYFGGGPVFRIGFASAIEQGVVARYDVKLLGVRLTPAERRKYDDADETVKDCRMRLVYAGFPEEPFGAFLFEVQKAAEDKDGSEDPTVVDVARRYLKAFSERVEIMSSAQAKLEAVREMAPRIQRSSGTILFTRMVDASEQIASCLIDEGVRAEAIHSKLSPRERRDRLDGLKSGRIKALAAPTVLDEGVDVPVIDLAVVLGGSKSRRQMIQRMGRVLRLKPNGGKATFVVVYAKGTVEDLTETDGTEGCLDLVMESADSVSHLRDGVIEDETKSTPSRALRMPTPDGDRGLENGSGSRREPDAIDEEPATTELPVSPAESSAAPSLVADGEPVDSSHKLLHDIDPQSLPMTRRALDSYQRVHGGSDAEAEAALRAMLADFRRLARVRTGESPQVLIARAVGFELVLTRDRFVAYRNRREEPSSWAEFKTAMRESGKARRPEGWTRPHPGFMSHPVFALDAATATAMVVSPQALRDVRLAHGHDDRAAEEELRTLLEDCVADGVCRRSGDHVDVGRSGYFLRIDPAVGTVSGYSAPAGEWSYTDYLELGPSRRRPVRPAMKEPSVENPLVLDDLTELADYVDPGDVYYSKSAFARAAEHLELGHLNSWDVDRTIRTELWGDLREATRISRLDGGRFVVHGQRVGWVVRQDGYALTGLQPVEEWDRDRVRTETRGDDHNDSADQLGEGASGPSPKGASANSSSSGDLVAQIERLVALRQQGFLTDEEFSAAKSLLLR